MSTEVAKVGQGPKIEYFLQGSILENHRELLLNRLKGLCDMAESPPEKFNDHEMVFSLRGPPPTTPVILNVRHALDHPDEPWHLKCVGTFDSGDAGRPTMTRNIVEVGVTSNITQFLAEMGFAMDFEYVAKGYVFRKGWLKTTVSKLNKVISPGNIEHLEPQSNFHLVELSVTASQSQDKVAEDIKNFAEQLKPLVVLEKLDYRRLPQ